MIPGPTVNALDAAPPPAAVPLDCGMRVATELAGLRDDLEGVADDDNDDCDDKDLSALHEPSLRTFALQTMHLSGRE